MADIMTNVKLLSLQGNKKTLILQEIPEGVKKILSNKEALASFDVTIFVYDR